MFFPLSKIVWALLSPLNLIFLIMIAGVLAGAFSRALGRSVMVLGLLLFILLGIFPTGPNLLAGLENRYQRPAPMPERVDGILVLGGAFMTDISGSRNMPVLNETADRIFEALSLMQAYPDAIVMFSGGNGQLVPNGRTEVQDTELLLTQIGTSQDNVMFEDESRNTYENLKYSHDLLMPQEGETWLLVTSAYHMPRAFAVARKAGWPGMLPYPTDYRTSGKTAMMPRKFDMLGNLYDTQVAIHEYLGLLAYQLTGKIELPLE